MSIIVCGPPKPHSNILLLFVHLGIWVELHSEHYSHEALSSDYYSLKILFIAALFSIHTGVNFFLFDKFFPMKVRQ